MLEKEFLVTLNVPPSLEEMVVDCLLLLESEQGFNSFMVNAHHHENKGLSLAEQVSGRQKRVGFQIYVQEVVLTKLLAQLQQAFANSGIHYWVVPVVEYGVL